MPLTFRSAWQTSPFAPTLPHMLFPYPSSQPLLNYLRPLKIWPQKWEGCPMCGLATAGVIPWHLCDLSASFLSDILSQWLVRSFLALIHLQSSCISQWTAAPADLAMVGFLSTRKGQGVLHLWYMNFFLLASASCSIQLRLEIWFSTTISYLLPRPLHEMWRKNTWDWLVSGDVILKFLVVMVILYPSYSYLLPFISTLVEATSHDLSSWSRYCLLPQRPYNYFSLPLFGFPPSSPSVKCMRNPLLP